MADVLCRNLHMFMTFVEMVCRVLTYRPYFWNSQSLLSNGQTCLVLSHLEMQWKWKAWLQIPQATVHSSLVAAPWLAWHSMQRSMIWFRQMAQLSTTISHAHKATAFHCQKSVTVSSILLIAGSYLLHLKLLLAVCGVYSACLVWFDHRLRLGSDSVCCSILHLYVSHSGDCSNDQLLEGDRGGLND